MTILALCAFAIMGFFAFLGIEKFAEDRKKRNRKKLYGDIQDPHLPTPEEIKSYELIHAMRMRKQNKDDECERVRYKVDRNRPYDYSDRRGRLGASRPRTKILQLDRGEEM